MFLNPCNSLDLSKLVSTILVQAVFWEPFEFEFKLNYNLNHQRAINQSEHFKRLALEGNLARPKLGLR